MVHTYHTERHTHLSTHTCTHTCHPKAQGASRKKGVGSLQEPEMEDGLKETVSSKHSRANAHMNSQRL